MAQLGERWRNQEEMWLIEDKMWLNGTVPDRDAVVPGSNSAPPLYPRQTLSVPKCAGFCGAAKVQDIHKKLEIYRENTFHKALSMMDWLALPATPITVSWNTLIREFRLPLSFRKRNR